MPGVRRPVTLMQAVDVTHLKDFVADLFGVKAGQSTHQNIELNWTWMQGLLGGTIYVCMTCGRSPLPREAQVTLIRKLEVPAGSAVLCLVRLDAGLKDFLVVP